MKATNSCAWATRKLEEAEVVGVELLAAAASDDDVDKMEFGATASN